MERRLGRGSVLELKSQLPLALRLHLAETADWRAVRTSVGYQFIPQPVNQVGGDPTTRFEGIGTARVEAAAPRRRDQGRRATGYRLGGLFVAASSGAAHEHSRVGMLRLPVYLIWGADFDKLTRVHDSDLVCELTGQPEVMCDEDV